MGFTNKGPVIPKDNTEIIPPSSNVAPPQKFDPVKEAAKTAASSNDIIQKGLENMKSAAGKYADAPAIQQFISGWPTQNIAQYESDNPGKGGAQQIKQYTDQFVNQFKNYVGREPTTDEVNTFWEQEVLPRSPYAAPLNQDTLKANVKTLLSDTFTKAAQDQATADLQTQAEKAVAPGSAYDEWANAYMGAVNNTEGALKDYQTRLFEKLRPNLITSLKTQGLLDTGALNTAFAGAASDLDATTANYMASARMGAATDIANQKMNIMSLPFQSQSNYTMNTVPNLTSAGQTALSNVWQQNLLTQQYLNERALQEMKMGSQPSALATIAGQMAGGIASNAAGGISYGYGQKIAKS
jgi:hypothetical protein